MYNYDSDLYFSPAFISFQLIAFKGVTLTLWKLINFTPILFFGEVGERLDRVFGDTRKLLA